VIRRGIRACLLSLSLLGLAPVAFTCEVSMPYHDCCPAGDQTPCDSCNSSVPSVPAALSCCAAVPAPLSAAVNAALVRPRAQVAQFGAIDHALASTRWAPTPNTPGFDSSVYPGLLHVSADPGPIYLLTRRLRL
jgi:hypothetical protein